MKNITRRMKGLQLQERWMPWVLLAAAVLTYGPLMRSLGFYWDDWEILYLSSAAEVPADIFLFPFRPLHVYLDIFTVRLLGYNPLYWHMLFLIIRYLGGLCFWLLLKEIWRDKPIRNAWAALLFLVYPSFLHSAMSVAYRQHFTTGLIFLFSCWLMARAYNLRRAGETKRFWLPFALSLLTGLVHLFITEYFAALEFWRPLILGILIWQDEPAWRERIGKLLFFWLPYLTYTGGYMIWRLVYVQSQIDDPNQAVLLDNLKAAPISTLAAFIQEAFIDLRYMLLDSWVDTLSSELINMTSPISLLVLAIIISSGLGFFWLIARLAAPTAKDTENQTPAGVFLLGFIGLLLGLAPAWLLNRHLLEGHYATRYSIPALAGASLMAVAIIFFLMPNHKRASAVLAVMLALAIGQQIHMSNEFRWDWTRQTRVYWQLHWRIPQVEENTAFLANRSLSAYATTYPVGYAINFLYSPDNLNMAPNNWWLEIYDSMLHTRIDDLYTGGNVRASFHNLDFRVPGTQSLVINLPTADEPNRCLWLLDAADTENTAIAPEMQQLAALSDLSRIIPEADTPPAAATFGTEPADTWCYYYQKADLAAQLNDWDMVNDLYAEAFQRGMSSNYGHEYLPFITASITAENWDQAAEQTRSAYAATKSLKPDLCVFWEKLETTPADQAAYQQAFEQVDNKLGCTGE